MNIAITGSSGFLGRAISERLQRDGHAITRVVRSRSEARKPNAIYWSPAEGEIDGDGLARHDAVINLAGESPFALWTRARKRRIHDSRVDGTRLLAETLAGLDPARRPGVLINASAVGWYGPGPSDRPLDEDAPPGEGFMADVVRDWEAAAEPARRAGVRVVLTRFAPVLDPEGFVLGALTFATRLGLGATLGDGRQPFPWVTRDDVAGVMPFLLEHPEISGPVNVVAPQMVTNRELTDTLARVLGRPRFLRIPAFALRLLGEQGNEFLGGSRVVPRKLEEAGYPWRDPELEPALRRMV